jgi:hypothetical protein
MREELRDAVCDLRYLLERGYKRKAAVDYVSNRYRLPTADRNLLLRAVYPRVEAAEHRRKLVGAPDIRGEEVLIDGYNVLITVEALLQGRTLVLCDDGYLRDTSAVYGKYRIDEGTLSALDAILGFLKKYSLHPVFIFDSQVSRSGELCGLIRERLREHGLPGDARTATQADKTLRRSGREKVISTSDTAVIKNAGRILDIPSHIAGHEEKIIRLPSCKNVYEYLLNIKGS